MTERKSPPQPTTPYSGVPPQDDDDSPKTLIADASDAPTVFGDLRPQTSPAVMAAPPKQAKPQKTVDSQVIEQAAPGDATLSGDDPAQDAQATAGDDTLASDETLAGDGQSARSSHTARGPLTAPTRLEGSEEPDELGDRIRAHLDEGPKRERKDKLLGELLGGRFLVLKKIGAGGMGAVYRARQEGMDRDVAVKVLLGDLTENDTVLRRFTLEALAVSRLKHPNTIQIFDYGTTPQGNPYIAMEMLEGSTLHDVLRKERPLPIRRALRIMAQVAASLGEAHGKGIVHRDLKPENIFLIEVSGNADFVKVLDFGVAKMADSKDEKGTLTQAGSIFGTPRYMSPEQCSAQPVDHRSDLYALGVILFEMVTGLPPFNSDQPLSLLLAHVNEQPPQPSSVELKGKDGLPLTQVIPAEVEDLILTLLEKNPVDRIQTSEDLSKECQKLAESLPPAFDARVGEAEAESLGVRLPSMHTMSMTSRTLRMSPEQAAAAIAGVSEAAPKKNTNALVAVVIGLVVATATAVGVLATQKPENKPIAMVAAPPPGTVIPPPALPPKEDEVTATLTSQPPGATVLRGNEHLGVTNLTMTRKKDAPPEVVQLVLPGYKNVEVTLNFKQNFMQHTQMIEDAAPPQPLAAPVPVAAGKAKPAATAVAAPSKPEAKAEPVKVEAPKPEAKAETPKAEAKEEKKEVKKKKEDLIDDLQ